MSSVLFTALFMLAGALGFVGCYLFYDQHRFALAMLAMLSGLAVYVVLLVMGAS